MAGIYSYNRNGKKYYVANYKQNGKRILKTFNSHEDAEEFLYEKGLNLKQVNKNANICYNKSSKSFFVRAKDKIKGCFYIYFKDEDKALAFREFCYDKYKIDPSYLKEDVVRDANHFKLTGKLPEIPEIPEKEKCAPDPVPAEDNEIEFLKIQIEIILERLTEIEKCLSIV